MDKSFERIGRELKSKGAIVDFYTDHVKLPNGNVVKWDFVNHKGAAAVVPVTESGKILMVMQYRNALDRYTIEIPAGGLDHVSESYKECASRELEEETGYASDELEFLISIKTTVAFCNEQIDVFVAKNLVKSEQNLDEDEFVEVKEWDVKDLMDLIFKGEIQDSKTVAAILAYHSKYECQVK